MNNEAELEYVGFWPRVGASVLDTLFVFVITWPLLIWIYGWGYFGSEKLVAGPADLLLSWMFPAVACVMFWIYKRVVGIAFLAHQGWPQALSKRLFGP